MAYWVVVALFVVRRITIEVEFVTAFNEINDFGLHCSLYCPNTTHGVVLDMNPII